MTIKKLALNSSIYVEKAEEEICKIHSLDSTTRPYIITIDGEVLLTPKGNPIAHSNAKALRELAAELDYSNELDIGKISIYNLACTEIDFPVELTEILKPNKIEKILLNDPVLKTCAGPEQVEQLKYFHSIEDYLKKHELQYPSLPQVELRDYSGFSKGETTNIRGIVDLIQMKLSGYNATERAVFITVLNVFDSLIMGLLLLEEELTSQEFAVIYLTALCINSKVWSDGDREEEIQLLGQISQQAESMIRYNQLFSKSKSEIASLVKSGESKHLEFKSTLRWNLFSNKSDPKMEHAVLKTIAAFLNTDGGTLIVGIDDNGKYVGIETDQFPNDDKYLLHFSNLVNSRIGKEFNEFMQWELASFDIGKVLVVHCKKCERPVFLKTKDGEQFFIRTGPSTVELDARELLSYTKDHFNE